MKETTYAFHAPAPDGGPQEKPWVAAFKSREEAEAWLAVARKGGFATRVYLVRHEATLVAGPYFHHLDPALAGRTE